MPEKRKVKNGFTLVELLVVVLIIGILAAIAVPQYQKAIEKSKAVQAITLLRAVQKAQEAYFLANGKLATDFNELIVDIPWTGRRATSTGTIAQYVKDKRSNEDWSLEFYDDGGVSNTKLYIVRLTGPHAGAGFSCNLKEFSSKITCIERVTNANPVYSTRKAPGSYCQKIMRGTFNSGVAIRYYNMPY